MVAKNMAELERMLMNHVNKAMKVASDKMIGDAYDATYSFYEGSNPKRYVRTGALGDTPKVTPITSGSNYATYRVYLDLNHKYSTGSKPTMEEVLNLANDGIPFITVNGYDARDTVGNKGFWQKAEKNFQRTLDSTFRSFGFKKI